MSRRVPAALAAVALLLAGCVGAGEAGHVREPGRATARPSLPPPTIIPPGPVREARILPPPADPLPIAPAGATARAQGVRPGPPVSALGITADEASAALDAFRRSCPSLVRRADASGLTGGADWSPLCQRAAATSAAGALGFFVSGFETAVIGSGAAYATGYYEPEIRGSRTRQPGYEVPIYARPDDLIEADLGLFAADLKGRKVRGQVRDGKLVLYPDRAAIVAGALAGKRLEVAWAADPVEFFFLQVQGSGLLRLHDGSIMRVGYDTQNGRDYTGIGRWMRDQGLLGPGDDASMQGIMARLRREPDGGAAIMNANKSFVFFRELGGAGPLGALGVPVAGRVSVAADPAFVPLGAPVFLALDRPEASGLWVAQDTGGAIKGANRIDTYWGTGAEARVVAGGMSARGGAWLLLPVGTVARINGSGADAGTPPLP